MFKLYLFGSPVLTRDNEPVHIRRKRSMALLAYIAMHERPQSREGLATLFWPEYEQRKAYANLRRELARLKTDIGQGLISSDRQTIGIEPAADLWVDVLTFAKGAEQDDPAVLEETIQLFTDDFMEGLAVLDSPEFDEWQFFQTERLRSTFSILLQRFLEIQAKEKDYRGAVETARQWLLMDNLNEAAHQSLMRFYALSGQYAAAVRQYHICARTLEAELGIEPNQETKALHTAIETKKIAPPQQEVIETELSETSTEPEVIARRHNLPAFPDSFVGRQDKIEEIVDYITEGDGRLLSLLGIGGIGKTRLAVQSVMALIDTDYFPDGMFFVDLAGVESIDFILPAIAETIKFPLTSSTAPLDQLTGFLRKKNMLLLLDNFEHLQDGAFHLTSLLQKCPQLKLLITSRHQLNISGEMVLILDGLPLQQVSARRSEAVQLFQERAHQFAPALDLEAEKIFIQAICRLVDGMPLAIEMCAAWVHTLNCQEIMEEIQQGLNLLESGRIDIPERHRSIRAVFVSSYKLLNPGEQQALLALAIFQGGFSRQAAVEVAGATIMQLRSLVEKSLLGVRGRTAASRYQMHQLLRQFALEKMTTERHEEGRKRHARYFADLLSELDKLRLTAENEEIVSTVFVEMDNLRSVWRWLGRQVKSGKQSELICEILEKILPAWSFAYSYKTFYLEGKQLLNIVWKPMEAAGWEQSGNERKKRTFAIVSAILGRSCLELGQFEEAIRYSQRALAILRPLLSDSAEIESLKVANGEYVSYALRTWGVANYRVGDLAASEKNLIESLETAPTEITRAWALHGLGTLYSNSAKYEAALVQLNEALPLFEKLHDLVGVLSANIAIGSVYGRQRQYEEAIPRYREVARLARQLEQKGMLMMALNNLAECLNQTGQKRQVAEFFEESLALAKETGNQRWQSMIAQAFGFILLERGETQRAEENIRDGLELAIELKSQPDVLAGLFPMAHLRAQAGHFEEALIAVGFLMNNETATGESRLYATDLWEELSTELPPIFSQRAKAQLETATLDEVLKIVAA